MSEAVQWRLEGQVSHLQCGPLEGHVSSTWPIRFWASAWNNKPIDKFFALAPANAQGNLREHYIRGRDFIQSYDPAPSDDIVRQFYWRAAFHRDVTAVQIELVISLRTDLFNRDLESDIFSTVQDAQAFHAPALQSGRFNELTVSSDQEFEWSYDRGTSPEHLFLFRSEVQGISYLQLVHPSDFFRARLVKDEFGGWNLITVMFHERLEKGVIRRGRICGWFLPAENDLAVAVELAKRFIDEPLPLTA